MHQVLLSRLRARLRQSGPMLHSELTSVGRKQALLPLQVVAAVVAVLPFHSLAANSITVAFQRVAVVQPPCLRRAATTNNTKSYCSASFRSMKRAASGWFEQASRTTQPISQHGPYK